jgi:hypothetical protein
MIAALRQQSWQPHANDFHYRHIVYQTTQSTTADLFDRAVLPSLSDQTMCVARFAGCPFLFASCR